MLATFGRGHVVLFIARGEQPVRRKEPRPIRRVSAVVDANANFKPYAVLPGQRAEVLLPLDSPRRSENRDFSRENDDLSALRGDFLHAIVVTLKDISGV